MHAVVFGRNGGPDVLEYKEIPEPTAKDGQVVVDVEAVGVNFRDVYEREGRDYGSKPPAVVGVEGAGIIKGTGERVAWIGVPNSYSERVVAERSHLVSIPDGVSSEVRRRCCCRASPRITWPTTRTRSRRATGSSCMRLPAVSGCS